MKISPYTPNTQYRNLPVQQKPRQVAVSQPRFSGSDGTIASVIPFVASGVATIVGLAAVVACLEVRNASRRNRRRHDSESIDWFYDLRPDSYPLSNRPAHREPVIVHNDWNNSDGTITPRHSEVIVEDIREPEPAVIRPEGRRSLDQIG